MTYSPPAELVERCKRAIEEAIVEHEVVADDPAGHEIIARACLAASGLGEALGLLHRFVTEWQLERNDPQFSDPLAAEARALLARLDPKPSEGGVRK